MVTRSVLLIVCGLGMFPSVLEAGAGPDSLAQVDASQTDASQSGVATSPIQVSWALTFASKYLFLGVDLSDGNAVLQPELNVGVRNFSFTFWANHDLEVQKPNELDFVFAYAREMGRFTVSPGYAYYSYPNRNAWDPSQEVLLDISCSAPLSPSLRVNHDFDAGDGTYYTLGLSQGLESLALPLSLGANVFYQNHYYEQTGFTAAEFNVSAGYVAGPIEFSPSISYFATWENNDFAGSSRVPDTWHFAINVAQSF